MSKNKLEYKGDFFTLLSKVLYTYDEVSQREDLAVYDIVEGLKGMFSGFKKFALAVDDMKNSIHSQMMKSNTFFNERNWWYLHSVNLNFACKACKEDVGEEEFNDLLMDYFRDNDYEELKAIVRKWPSFGLESDLIPPINQVISAHMREEYFLTVATMIPIIEKLLYMTHNNHYELHRKKIGKIVDAFENDFSPDKIYFTNFLFILRFFKSGEFSEMDDFNRHKITHGQTMDFGKEIYSLKLILAIDEILRFRDLIQTVNFDSEDEAQDNR